MFENISAVEEAFGVQELGEGTLHLQTISQPV
jgi:hypothetical protein